MNRSLEGNPQLQTEGAAKLRCNMFCCGLTFIRHRLPRQPLQHGPTVFLDFRIKKIVGTCHTKIDGGNPFALLPGVLRKTEPGEHHERRADDQQAVCSVDGRHAMANPILRDAVTEKHDIGLEYTATGEAGRDADPGISCFRDHSVAVGRWHGSPIEETAVGLFHPRLHFGASSTITAGEANDLIQAAVQFDDTATARLLMQSIDVLRNDRRDQTKLFQSGYRNVSTSRLSRIDGRPTDEASCPVSAAHGLRVQKFSMVYGFRVLPLSVPVAIIRDPAFRTQPGSGQNSDRPVAQQCADGSEALFKGCVEGRHVVRKIGQAWSTGAGLIRWQRIIGVVAGSRPST